MRTSSAHRLETQQDIQIGSARCEVVKASWEPIAAESRSSSSSVCSRVSATPRPCKAQRYVLRWPTSRVRRMSTTRRISSTLPTSLPSPTLTLPQGVSLTIESADQRGWRATASHEFGIETCFESGRNDGNEAIAVVEGPTCKMVGVTTTARDVRGRKVAAAAPVDAPTPLESDATAPVAVASSRRCSLRSVGVVRLSHCR